MVDVTIAFPHEQADWEHRHDLGLVPGQWPYGLDAIGRAGVGLSRCTLPVRNRLGRGLAELRERLPGGRVGDRADRVLLTWDENSALRMVGARGGLAHYSGVIWLTDREAGQFTHRQRDQLRRCAGLWVLSRAQEEPLRQLLGPGGPPVHFLRFGIDTSFFPLAPYPQRPLVVSVGGDRDRDPELLFSALGAVHAACPEAEIVVQTRSTARPPDGISVVSQLSHLDLRRLYERMSVAVIATRPNLHVSGMTVGLESRSIGRPVVTTDSPGMADYAPPGSGAVLTGREPGELADAVIDLLRNPADALACGAAGSAYVLANHTQEVMADDLIEMIA